MDAPGSLKPMESQCHEALYNNLLLLKEFFPGTTDFNKVLKKNMFMKANKIGFLEVTHYLLNILDSNLTKQMLPSWPVIDTKDEVKYRSDLVAYIKTINSNYPHGNIPVPQPSTLISPGGFKFVIFVLKLSQLVLAEYLEENCDTGILMPTKYSKLAAVREVQKKHLKLATSTIEQENNKTLQVFYEEFLKAKMNADSILKKLKTINGKIKGDKQKLEETQAELESKYQSTAEDLKVKIDNFKREHEKLQDVASVFKTCKNLLLELKNMVLIHDETRFPAPDDVTHVILTKKTIDLNSLLQVLAVVLETKALHLRGPSSDSMQETEHKLKELIFFFEKSVQDLKLHDHETKILLEDLESINEQ